MGAIHACSTKDREQVEATSLAMGFLCGDEAPEMVEAHVDAALLIGEPFATPGPFDFRQQDITEDVKA